jgi:hypothetical protein
MKALDSQKNTIQIGDTVKVIEGPFAVSQSKFMGIHYHLLYGNYTGDKNLSKIG